MAFQLQRDSQHTNPSSLGSAKVHASPPRHRSAGRCPEQSKRQREPGLEPPGTAAARGDDVGGPLAALPRQWPAAHSAVCPLRDPKPEAKYLTLLHYSTIGWPVQSQGTGGTRTVRSPCSETMSSPMPMVFWGMVESTGFVFNKGVGRSHDTYRTHFLLARTTFPLTALPPGAILSIEGLPASARWPHSLRAISESSSIAGARLITGEGECPCQASSS